MKKALNLLYVTLVLGIMAEMGMDASATRELLLLRIGLCVAGLIVVVLTTLTIFRKTESRPHRTACLIAGVVYVAALVSSRFVPKGALQVSLMTVWVAAMLALIYLSDDRRFEPDFIPGSIAFADNADETAAEEPAATESQDEDNAE